MELISIIPAVMQPSLNPKRIRTGTTSEQACQRGENEGSIARTERMIALAGSRSTNENGPYEHLTCEVFGNREFLKSIGMRELRDQIADIEESAKIVKLLDGHASVGQEAQDRDGTNCIFIEELD
jgi:hypothetical protein